MKRDPVVLSDDARRIAADALIHALVTVHQFEVLSLSVNAMHVHVLARFGLPALKPTASRRGLRHGELRQADPARYYLGIAKERSAKALVHAGVVAPGGIWARRGKIVPIRDRSHQLNVYRYILDHAQQGAAVWSFRDEC